MLSPAFASVVALTMLAVCGVIAVTFVKIVNSFDAHEPHVETKPNVHAHAA